MISRNYRSERSEKRRRRTRRRRRRRRERERERERERFKCCTIILPARHRCLDDKLYFSYINVYSSN